MVSKSKPPTKPAAAPPPGFAPTVPAPFDPYMQGERLPEPDVIERDSDSVWALWSDALKDPEEKDTEPMPPTRLMDLDELPRDPDA